MSNAQLLLLATVLVLASKAQAIGTFASMGYSNAGQRMMDVAGGPDQRIRAGTGTFFSLGVVQAVTETAPHRFEAQLSFSYMYASDGNEKEQNTISFNRYPMDALYFYRNTQENFRFGYGVTYHVMNSLTGRGTYAALSQSVDPALGWVVTVEKLMKLEHGIGPQYASLGIRYQSIQYKASSFTQTADASAIMITGSYFTF